MIAVPVVGPDYRRLIAIAVVALILVACLGVGVRLANRAHAPVVERLATQGEQAKDEAAARGLEAAGAAQTGRDVAQWRRANAAAEEILDEQEDLARADGSGQAPLGDDRARRLRHHDDWLCAHSGLVCLEGGRPGAGGRPPSSGPDGGPASD
ncbi:hypothetical protein [Phenylobacterium sp.]|uniref:hypothetical protein n=1 Tax=Phenylobacterium sp. TaxID=1871053 RepID=UPI004035C56D